MSTDSIRERVARIIRDQFGPIVAACPVQRADTAADRIDALYREEMERARTEAGHSRLPWHFVACGDSDMQGRQMLAVYDGDTRIANVWVQHSTHPCGTEVANAVVRHLCDPHTAGPLGRRVA